MRTAARGRNNSIFRKTVLAAHIEYKKGIVLKEGKFFLYRAVSKNSPTPTGYKYNRSLYDGKNTYKDPRLLRTKA